MTAKQAMKRLAITRGTLYQYVKSGKIRGAIKGSRYEYNEEDVERLASEPRAQKRIDKTKLNDEVVDTAEVFAELTSIINFYASHGYQAELHIKKK